MYTVSTSPCCSEFNRMKLNAILAAVSGTIFAIGWWLTIDMYCKMRVNGLYVLPSFFGTLALVAVNLVPIGMIKQPSFYGSSTACGTLMVKIYLLIGFMVAFGALIGGTFILCYYYALDNNVLQKWPGVAIFLSNFFIFSATVVLRFRAGHDTM